MQRVEPPRRSGRMAGGSTGSAVAYTGRGPAWVSEPERAVPVDVPCDRVLIDTPCLVAFIAAVHVYRSSFCFTLSARLRPSASAQAEDAFIQAFTHGFAQVPAEQAERSLRLGARFADGRGAALNPNLRGLPHGAPRSDTLPSMHAGRMSSSSGTADHEVWIVGLPEVGDIELFYRWLELDVPESSIELDGDAIRSASARAMVLWEAPTGETPDPRPAVKDRPAGRGGG